MPESLPPGAHNHLEDFHSLPWASALLTSSDFLPPTPEQTLPPPPDSFNVPNLFWSRTLHGPGKLRAWQWLVSSKPPAPGYVGPECIMLVSLAEELNGYEGKLHGGMFGMLVDQVGGICGRNTIREDFMTREIKIGFAKAIPVPSVVLCRARAKKVEGRKMWIDVWLEDGQGTVYCEAETFWLILKKDVGGSKI